MRSTLCGCLVLLVTVVAHAQFMGGTGFASGGAYGGGAYPPGATVPRVNAAPFAGSYGGQAAFGFQAGAGRGIYGVTRRTFMGDANAVAAAYFNRAGVPLPAQTPSSANQPGGAYFGRRQPTLAPVNRVAAGASTRKLTATQRGAAATEHSTPEDSIGCTNNGGDFAAQGEKQLRSVTEQFEGKSLERSDNLRWLRKFPNMAAQNQTAQQAGAQPRLKYGRVQFGALQPKPASLQAQGRLPAAGIGAPPPALIQNRSRGPVR